MGDVTGPISSLPGKRHELPKGAMCDEHPNRKAVVRIQGETDSFGCEMYDLCQECFEAERKAEADIGECDWCKAKDQPLRPRRDIDEGTHGPVYYVCATCAKKDEDAILAELAYYDNGYNEDYD